MPDRWTAVARGRPLALVIKLRNCTDNESVCLRVKALGDTQPRRRPCWRCQERSELVPLPSSRRFRPQPFLLSDVTISPMNQFKFKYNNPKSIIPPNLFAFTSPSLKGWDSQKARELMFRDREGTEKNVPVHFRWTSVVNGAVNTKLLHSACSLGH